MKKEDNINRANRVQKGKKNKKRRSPLRAFVLMLLVLAVIAGSVYTAYRLVIKDGNGLNMVSNLFEKEKLDQKTIYVLVMGTSGNMTDTIMLCGYNQKENSVSVLSIPRDTKIATPNTASSKINSIYQGQYPEKTVEKVEEITGIHPDYYVVVDTKVLIDVVDTIGGVTVDVPIRMKYDDKSQNLHIDLKKGTQTLTGKQAEWFVRFRHNNDGTGYPNGDLGRIEAQQAFIKALVDDVMQPKNIAKIPSLINVAFKNVKTNIKLSEALAYASDVSKFDKENIRMEMIPGTTPDWNKTGGVSFFVYDKQATLDLVYDMFLKSEDTENTGTTIATTSNTNTTATSSTSKQKSEIKIEILNGSTNTALLNKVTEKLKNEGYKVVKVGNTTTTSKTKIIDRCNDNGITDLKKTMSTIVVEKGETVSNIDYTIVIGNDYK